VALDRPFRYLTETRGISLSLANTTDGGATLVDADRLGLRPGRLRWLAGWPVARAAGPEPDRRGHAADQRRAQVTQFRPSARTTC
jgi:hypothetical protein